MKTPIVAQFVSFLAVVPIVLSAQLLRDTVPLRHWPAPLYWQPDLADLHPLAATPTQPNPLTFIGMTPCRVVDTRTGSGFNGAFGAPSLVGGVSRTIPMQSSTTCSIPATALAYSLNVTVVPPASLGFISLWPTGQLQPLVSTLNDLTGTVVANAAIVPGGTSGSIDVYASNNTDLIIDINGYYAASFGTPSGGYQFPDASGTPLMTITPIGNMGIGTATPGSALDVAGDINLSGSLRLQGMPVLRVQAGPPCGTSCFPSYSVGVGPLALFSNTTGQGNTALGGGFPTSPNLPAPLGLNTTGSDNTAIGFVALALNTTGRDNTALGGSALSSNTTGGGNTAVGSQALNFSSTGYFNTATGEVALSFNTTGNGNTANGNWALFHNTTGNYNTAAGYSALYNNTTGSNNIAIGNDAAMNAAIGNSNNIHIGTQGASADNGTIRIGGNTNLGDTAAQTQFFVAGVRGIPTANNDAIPVMIDSAGQLGTVSSSRRYKEDIQDMGDASSGLMRLRPVTFRYQKPFADGSKPIQYGLIAEEVAEVYPDLVAHSADGQIETVKYQVLDSMLLNEVQRLNKENQALQERLSRLEATMASVASGAGVQ